MIKRMFLWIVSIWYVVITIINYKLGLPWKLLLYDICSGFRDNEIYLMRVFLPVTVTVLILSIIFVLVLERKLIMYWEIRITRYSFSIGKFGFVRKYKKKFMLLTVMGAVSLLAVLSCKGVIRGREIWGGTKTVAHAGGRIDDNDYTNCLEAIISNYEKGQRVFEIDFSVTSDNKLVCKHDWDYVMQEGGAPGEMWDEQKFLSTPIWGQYTPLSFELLCQLMEEYPDLWVVTDTKNADTEAVQRDFEIMVNTAKECNLDSVLDRVIVQIYNEEMYDTVYHIYPFKSWIYTLYQFWPGDIETFQECVRFCYGHDINAITTWNYFVTPELLQISRAYGIPWYAHTENDVENAKSMIRQGLTGIYTDCITPDMLKEE